jgi:hypothetical protein
MNTVNTLLKVTHQLHTKSIDWSNKAIEKLKYNGPINDRLRLIIKFNLEKGLLTFMDDKHFIPIVNMTEKNIFGSEIRKDKVKETVIFDRYEGTVLWGLLAIENGGTVSQSYSCKKLKKTL